MQIKLKIILGLFLISALFITAKISSISNDGRVISASASNGNYSLKQISEYASIYDCNGKRLNNCSYEYFALINPKDKSAVLINPYILDDETYNQGIIGNLPFLCKVNPNCKKIKEIIVFKKAVRTDENQLARHIIGYTSENNGVCGIEYAYNSLLRGNYSENKATFSVNAVGNVLKGLYSNISFADDVNAGVVTTIDSDIQKICESAFLSSDCYKGAVIVMDVKTGEIKACASFPTFNPQRLDDSLGDNNAPFVNRAFSAYNVGSIFKLVTATAALESGISPEYTYDCSGKINVSGQVFNCHKWGGHGEINMNDAMVNSCNPYFIALGEYINSDFFIETARNYSFGKETELCSGMTSSAGYLPTAKELSVKAEKGNFSFGQGKLTATPLQICTMTAAIANDGIICEPQLIVGVKDKDGIVNKIEYNANHRVISFKTARILKGFMVNTVNAQNSMSKSDIVSSGGKTSTAQTGRFLSNGTEILNCWFTGYFPSDKPKYAVTIIAEEKNSGNSSAAPIYKKIAEYITENNL